MKSAQRLCYRLEIAAPHQDVIVIGKHAPGGRGIIERGNQTFAEGCEPRVRVTDVRPMLETSARQMIEDGTLVEMRRAMPRALEQLAISKPSLPALRGQFSPEIRHESWYLAVISGSSYKWQCPPPRATPNAVVSSPGFSRTKHGRCGLSGCGGTGGTTRPAKAGTTYFSAQLSCKLSASRPIKTPSPLTGTTPHTPAPSGTSARIAATTSDSSISGESAASP